MKGTFITKDSIETKELAKDLAKTLKGHEVIALYGDLGAGKTTFAQGLAEALGVKRQVNSPTFIVHRTYSIGSNSPQKDFRLFHHIDLYRIEDEKALSGLGLAELMGQKDAVIVIEWPEKLQNLLPKKRIEIRLEYINENERKVTIL